MHMHGKSTSACILVNSCSGIHATLCVDLCNGGLGVGGVYLRMFGHATWAVQDCPVHVLHSTTGLYIGQGRTVKAVKNKCKKKLPTLQTNQVG